MIESPLIQELVDEAVLSQKQKDILQILKVRFGDVPAEVSAKVEAKRALDELEPLFDASATAPSLDAFKERLQIGTLSRPALQRMIRDWSGASGDRLRPFCGVVVYYLRKRLARV